MRNKILTFSLILLAIILLSQDVKGQDEEPAAPPIKCYVCGGADGKCSSPDDLGIEKTCDAGTFTCIVATENDEVYRRCDTTATQYEDCVNGGDFCYCLGDLCNGGPRIESLSVLLTVALITGFVRIFN